MISESEDLSRIQLNRFLDELVGLAGNQTSPSSVPVL
jgi:hypothetical protein